MMSNKLALLDKNFINTLLEQKDREVYARITALTFDENPVDQIEGRVTTGSVSIDGSSTIRRTCSLTLLSKDVNINEFYWGLRTKFILEVGLRNKLTGEYKATAEGKYPDIVWFPQGCYVISTFNTSFSTNNCTISVQGKDKMSLLNGDFGGQLYASVNFGTEEEETIRMELVDLDKIPTSEGVILGNYYIQPTDDNKPYSILASDPFYLFVFEKEKLDKNSYYYYKSGKFYRKKYGNQFSSYEKPYRAYKTIETPKELYAPIVFTSDEPYVKNTYYYEKSGNESYFLLDSSKEAVYNRNYYKLVNLYQKQSDITIKKRKLEDIIRDSVHTYAQEPYHNIIINDLDDFGLEQITYKGDSTLYALCQKSSGQFTNLILKEMASESFLKLIEKQDFKFYSLNGSLIDLGTEIYRDPESKQYTALTEENSSDINNIYSVAKFTYGMDLGYRLTDLTYTGDLITNVGDTLTSMLDKIKKMLGEFEYFYDINGRFIFQKKKNYLETSWSQLTDNGDEKFVNFANDENKFSFNFEGNNLITAISNTPSLTNLRNDYIVWGKRKGATGADIPIHGRYAIDKKPVYYKTLNGHIYTTKIAYAIEQGDFIRDEYNTIAQETKEDIIDKIKQFNNKFIQSKKNYPKNLDLPEINLEDGTCSPGWWLLSDWAEYYKILNGTNQNPQDALKLYSQNDATGCISIEKILDITDSEDRDYFSEYQKHHYSLYENRKRDVWLLEVKNDKHQISLVHSGRINNIFNKNNYKVCSFYEDDDLLKNYRVKYSKIIYVPFANCSDTHTYDYSLQEENTDFYFYNPCFSKKYETIPELIEKQIKDKKNKWLRNNRTLLDNYKIHIVDWREIIYQMALDFFAGQGCSEKNPLYITSPTEQATLYGIPQYEDTEKTIPKMKVEAMTNPDHFLHEIAKHNPSYYPTGYTGYEQYYTDMQEFWRKIYNPDYIPQPSYSNGEYTETSKKETGSSFYTRIKEWNEPTLTNYKIDYYIDKNQEAIARQLNYLYRLKEANEGNKKAEEYEALIKKYESMVVDANYEEASGRLYWSNLVFEQPETLNFWIDFLDSDLELSQFAVSQVGDRTKVVKEDKIGAIIYSTVPNFILFDKTEKNEDGTCNVNALRREILDKSGYTFMYSPPGFSKYLTISYRGDSVKNKIDSLLYQYGYCTESISITAIPIYNLEPNTRVYVRDENTKINGEYIVNKITVPLSYNGTMSITASKAPKRIY